MILNIISQVTKIIGHFRVLIIFMIHLNSWNCSFYCTTTAYHVELKAISDGLSGLFHEMGNTMYEK